MQKLVSNLTVLLMSQILTGCELAATGQESAARIPVHSDESLTELRQTAQQLFGGREITVGANAFSSSNQLLIQRVAIRSPDGMMIDTRVDEPPFILELFIREGGCYLKNKSSGEALRLYQAECKAM
ncbi:hypothetical protein [uncultured Umboniibacter sp.]|uniref:hypothetical protein n=1 Tax=uncultured Umboniibacter sp. TaxID=1798917 RepID=UPI00261E28F7|nr:hypothetical protein [uncultured Umboniibacter sp.]